MSTIREQLKTTFLGLAGLLSKMNVMQSSMDSIENQVGDLNTIIESINGDTVDNIVNQYITDEAEQIENIIGDWTNE
jgi:hypothetical protein